MLLDVVSEGAKKRNSSSNAWAAKNGPNTLRKRHGTARRVYSPRTFDLPIQGDSRYGLRYVSFHALASTCAILRGFISETHKFPRSLQSRKPGPNARRLAKWNAIDN